MQKSVADRRSVIGGRQERTVAMARPMIVLLGGLGVFWAVGNLMMAVTAAVRIVRGSNSSANLTLTEAVFLMVRFGLLLLMPLALMARHLRRDVWGNTLKAVALAERLRRPVIVGLAAYGFASLLIRWIRGRALSTGRGRGVARVGFCLLLFVACGAVVGAHLVAVLDSKR